MTPKCRAEVNRTLGRNITDSDAATITRRLQRSMRYLARDPDFKRKPRQTQLALAADHAAQEYVAEQEHLKKIAPDYGGAALADPALVRAERQEAEEFQEQYEPWMDGLALDQSSGLDMSQEARMARAEAMGFDTSTVFYHGTTADFDQFSRVAARRAGAGQGSELGIHVGTVQQANDIQSIRRFGSDDRPYQEDSHVIPVYIRTKNSLRLPDLESWSKKRLIKALKKEGIEVKPTGASGEVLMFDIRTAIREAGYDSIVYLNKYEGARGGRKPQDSRIILDENNIRSVNAAFDPRKEASARILDQSGGTQAPIFFSQLQRFVENAKQPKAPADQWKAMISKAPGIKAEEIEWTGVNEWLDAQEGSVSREDLAAYLANNGVTVEEVTKGGVGRDTEGQRSLLNAIERRDEIRTELDEDYYSLANNPSDMADDKREAMFALEAELDQLDLRIASLEAEFDGVPEDGTKWSTWTLPGGENYTELLLTLPVKPSDAQIKLRDEESRLTEKYGEGFEDQLSTTESLELGALRNSASLDRMDSSAQYKSSHWDEPNVLAHVRFKERTGPNGERILAMEEIQSDWHQDGRKRGYDDDASFKAWWKETGHKLFTEEYEDFDSLDADTQKIVRESWAHKQGNRVPSAPFKNNAWASLVIKRMIRHAAENGFDAIAWIPGNIQNGQVVDAEDGRSDFYDKIIPNLAGKIGKKYGAKVGKLDVTSPYDVANDLMSPGETRAFDQTDQQVDFWSLPITPELKAQAIQQGFPLFQRGRTSGDPKGWGLTDPPENLEEVTLDLDAVRDGYGKPDDPYYAVRRLPLQVRRAAAAKQDIDDLVEQAKQAREALKAKPPKSLIGFLRSRRIGGLKDSNDELKRMDAGRERGLINNKSGTDLDYAREAAEEAGYISPTSEDGRTTIQDLLDALDSELAGNPVYAARDFEEAFMREQAEEIESRFSAVDVDIMSADDATLRSAAEGMVSQGQTRAVTPDEAADMFGFENGEQLLEAMYQMRHRRKLIEQETDRRFAEEMGDNFIDGQLTQEARLEAEAEVRMRQVEIEQEAMRRVLGGQSAKALAKEKAKERVQQMSVAELGRYRRFKQAERRHGENALKALEDGDLQQSMMHKQRQLTAMYMFEEAEKASDKVEKTRKHLMGYYTMKGRRRQIDPEYLEKIESILEGYELRSTKQSGAARREALSAAQWVLEMKQAERDDEITPEAELLAEQGRKQVWKALTLEEANYLRATVDNIAHLGRTKNKLLSEREKRKFNQIIDSLVNTLDAANDIDGQREYSERPTIGEKASRRARVLHSWNMRMEHELRALDKKENGALWNALFRPFTEAADWKSKASRESAKNVRKLYAMYSVRERWHMHNTSRDIPELGPPTGKRWTKMDVISIALNWGVPYNREALLEGYGWTPDQVEAALARMMTQKDWDFVEGIWQEAGRYKEEAFALEKQMTGVEPEAVEGIDFEIMVEGQPRKIEGKYYHLEYRNDVLTPQALKQYEQENREALSTRMKNYSRPQTRNGGLIARKGSGGKQVRLNISVFENQVADTIHDIAYRRAVIDTTRIIKNERFALAFQQAAGPEMYNQLMPWIEGIVKMPSERLDNFITTMRRNLPASYMGMKVGTAMIQVSGLALAAPIIGARYLAYGVGQTMLGNPMSLIGSYQAVAEKSEFMRDRPQGYDRDIREVTSAMGEEGPLGMIRRNAFVLISAMDIMVSTPIWIGAYQKAMDGKVDGIEKGNDADAIAWADSVIRRTQTAGLPQDLARIMRDSESWKMLTMIMGYFNNLYGWSAQQVRSLRAGETGPMQFLAFAMAAYLVTPLVAEALSGRLFDEGDDEDDTLASRSGAAIISNFAGMFPVVRDMVNYKLKPQFGFKMSPVVSGTDDVARTAGSLWDILAQNDNAEWTEVETKRAVRAMGAMFGIPSSQILITGDYIADVINGEEDPLEEPGRIFTEGLLRNTDYRN